MLCTDMGIEARECLFVKIVFLNASDPRVTLAG